MKYERCISVITAAGVSAEIPTYLLAVLSTATPVVQESVRTCTCLQEGGHVYVGVREDCFLHVVDLATYTVRQPYCAQHL